MKLLIEIDKLVSQNKEDTGAVLVLVQDGKTGAITVTGNLTKYQKIFACIIGRLFQLSLYVNRWMA